MIQRELRPWPFHHSRRSCRQRPAPPRLARGLIAGNREAISERPELSFEQSRNGQTTSRSRPISSSRAQSKSLKRNNSPLVYGHGFSRARTPCKGCDLQSGKALVSRGFDLRRELSNQPRTCAGCQLRQRSPRRPHRRASHEQGPSPKRAGSAEWPTAHSRTGSTDGRRTGCRGRSR